jgi:hypothetical protein
MQSPFAKESPPNRSVKIFAEKPTASSGGLKAKTR